MIAEADRIFPYETGGVLLGYWDESFKEVVIDRVLGPGPDAIHRRESFIPDARYHEQMIAYHYEASGRLHTYIGDWHTHPLSVPYLSRKDRRTLKKIAKHEEARAPIPIMTILGGPPWEMKVWRYSRNKLARVFSWPELHDLDIRSY